MINKFRYKKPQQTTNNAKNCCKNENTCDNSVNCKSVKQQQQNQCSSDNQNKNNETNSAGVLTDDERKKLKVSVFHFLIRLNSYDFFTSREIILCLVKQNSFTVLW